LLSVAWALNAVDIVKVTDAVPCGPTALLNVRAFKDALTDPTAGVEIYAACESTEVLTFIPPLNAPVTGSTVTGDAGRAAKVNPVQVTVICCGEISSFTSTIMIPVGVEDVIPVLSITDDV